MNNLCDVCKKRKKAVNYVKDEVTHYRSMCSHCMRLGKKIKPHVPSWVMSGYKKKNKCDRCGFLSKWADQIFVYYVDGSHKNNDHSNLRSICANCSIDLIKSGSGWKSETLKPDC